MIIKKIYLLALLTLSSLTFGQDLLLNGGFEGLATGNLSTGTSPWSTSNTVVPFPAISATGSRTGSNNLLLPNDFVPFRQSFTAVSGTTYTLTLYALFTNATLPSSTDGIFVSVRDNTGGNGTQFTPNLQFYITPTTVTDSYVKYTYTFVAPQTNLILSVSKQARVIGTNPNNTARVDDLSIIAGATSAVTVTGTAPYNYTFDGTRKSPTFSSIETITYAYSGGSISGTQALGPINAGSYLALAKVPEGTGFAYLAIPFTIDKATPTITPTIGTYTYTGLEQGPNSATTVSTGVKTYSYSGISPAYGPSATQPTLAGNYTVTASVASTSNYNTASSTATAFSIAQAPLTITGITADNKTYDGLTTANLSGSAAYAGLQNGELFSVTGTPTASFDTPNVGTLKTVSVLGYNSPSSNYTLTVNLTASITKASLTITANTTTIVYGDAYPTTGSTDFTSSGLQNSETIGSITLSNGSGGIIGTYTTFPSAAIGGTFTASNYTITYTTGLLTINPKIGDYRTKASGDWGTLTTWERWSGSAWVEPTVIEGYPGQLASPSVVYIQSTHNVNGNRTIGDPNPRLKELLFLSGAGDSSLTIIGSNSIQINNQVRVLSGGNRTINVGAGFLSVGSITFSDSGSDSIDSKLTISTGAVFVSGSLVMNGSSERNAVEFTGTGSLRFINNGTMTGGSLIPAAGTVYYNGPLNQAVGSYAYTNLVLRGDGIKTVPADVTIASNLTIDGSAIANLYTGITYYVGTLTLGCRDSEDGTWGSTTSAAFYTNDIYFEPTTGLIDVSIDTSLKIPVTTEVQPTCAAPATATITITVQYALETYSFDNGVTYQTSNIKTGLSAGTYYVIIKNSKGCFSPTTNVTLVSATRNWNGSVSTDWNTAANWTPAVVPTADNCVVISYSAPWRNPTITGNAVAYNLIVKDDADAKVDTGHTLKVTDVVRVNSGGSSLVFNNNASLIQINNVANIGNIQYKRTTPSLIETDYTYWSSPVEGQNLNISPDYAYGAFYYYDYTAGDWAGIAPTSTMDIGKGYIMRGQKADNTSYAITATFSGVPNNGPKTIAIGPAETANLIGNPYPSALDADVFLSENSTKIEGTLYFWTHKTPIQLASLIVGNDEFGNPKVGSGLYAYTSDDYATYNGTGGAAANSGGIPPSGKIAAGQGFFANSLASGEVTFTNAMRFDGLENPLDNSNFYKTKKPKLKALTDIQKHRVWLNLTNSKGAFKQTLIGYISEATNDYDNRFDGESFDGNDFVDFYSINQDKNLVIQGRALPFTENDEVPLGFRTTINGEFTIKIDQFDGLFTNQAVFIEDKLTNSITNLKTSNYTFNTTTGTFNERFVLRFREKTLRTNDLETQLNRVMISIKNNQIKINSLAEIIEKVTIHDLLGRQIYQKDKISSNEFIVSNLVSSHQTLLVKTSLQNGKTVTEKIIY